MQILYGETAFSAFRLQRLQQTLQAALPSLQSLSAYQCFFVDAETTLSTLANSRLQSLLRAKPILVPSLNTHSVLRIAVPRLGTQSPWSSKATDILWHCGLKEVVRRIERGIIYILSISNEHLPLLATVYPMLYDPMLETLLSDLADVNQLFQATSPEPLQTIDIQAGGKMVLLTANQNLGLGLSDTEIDYLLNYYQRDPTDIELMMFAQANSEHCRHKIFKAEWTIDGIAQPSSLFAMIKNTFHVHQEEIISAYHDNAAILQGQQGQRFFADPKTHCYQSHVERIHSLIKVETHNHPTAIAPFPGAATGAGGEIRDEGATGRGAKPKAALTGFSVSNLRIPGLMQSWEHEYGKPDFIASALDIMLTAPIGAASFNNEFGRPAITGYFRTFEQAVSANAIRAYHKPIMLAGGIGNIRPAHCHKGEIPPGALLLVLGGPAMLIGLGGGTASSQSTGQGKTERDFASVQRGNPEMQRRCQEVIDQCWALGDDNPIISIHDVGAGGLANALPEMVYESRVGAYVNLRAIPCADAALSPLQIWCNEAQERYVLAILPTALAQMQGIAERERCPLAVIGEATKEMQLVVVDPLFRNTPIDVSLKFLLGDMPRLQQRVTSQLSQSLSLPFNANVDLREAAFRVLQHPCVASKNFLITIADRSVGGLVARDQMVGPWQVPVADCAVTLKDYHSYVGEAMTVAERAPVALLNSAATARLAVAEAITNILASDVATLDTIKLSANWMAAAGHEGEALALFAAVKALGMELCPALHLTIPVGKDSLSMQTSWEQDGQHLQAVAPQTVVISAFAEIKDARKTLTPFLQIQDPQAVLLLLDFGQQRLGGSTLCQVYQGLGTIPPDIDDPQQLQILFNAIKRLKSEQLLLAYHDRSDGGLLACLCEMAFASHTGLTIELDALGDNPLASLFNEECGVVVQVSDKGRALACLNEYAIKVSVLGKHHASDEITFKQHGKVVLQAARIDLQKAWQTTSYHMCLLRDNPICAEQEYATLSEQSRGLYAKLTFEPPKNSAPAFHHHQPRIAILREQGVNGHIEMAASFAKAGFMSIDVHMTDLLAGRVSLRDFKGMAACGGFSYGDVLGAGTGWANTILHHDKLSTEFAEFFTRDDTFTLGVCNGCQMLAQLKSLIPGAQMWPRFTRNQSEQFEARLTMVKVNRSPSLFFTGMAGACLPIVVSHGEGRVEWSNEVQQQQCMGEEIISLTYVDDEGIATERYPANPNGSWQGITGLTTEDGRVTILMPHPERVFRSIQFSWHPSTWGEDSPWLQMFINAYQWVNR